MLSCILTHVIHCAPVELTVSIYMYCMYYEISNSRLTWLKHLLSHYYVSAFCMEVLFIGSY